MGKICSIEQCGRSHHARGFCKFHYKKYLQETKYNLIKCKVDGCENPVYCEAGPQGLCVKHFRRLKRNGSVDIRKRKRDVYSFVDKLAECDDPWGFNITSDLAYAEIARAAFGDKCARCGWNIGKCEVHHKTYRKEGGLNTLSNAEMLCPNCHSIEHHGPRNDVSEEYRARVKQILTNPD